MIRTRPRSIPSFALCCGHWRLASWSSCSGNTGWLSSSTGCSRLEMTDSLAVRSSILLASEWTRGTCGQGTLTAAPSVGIHEWLSYTPIGQNEGRLIVLKMLPCDWLSSTGLRKVVRIILKWFKVKTKMYC